MISLFFDRGICNAVNRCSPSLNFFSSDYYEIAVEGDLSHLLRFLSKIQDLTFLVSNTRLKKIRCGLT